MEAFHSMSQQLVTIQSTLNDSNVKLVSIEQYLMEMRSQSFKVDECNDEEPAVYDPHDNPLEPHKGKSL